jgi:hypothetical protein
MWTLGVHITVVCFIILTYLVPALFTFYIQDVLKLKKNNSGAKRLIRRSLFFRGWMWTLGVHITVVCFIILTYLVPALFTFYVQGVLKLKKNNSGAKRLMRNSLYVFENWQKIVTEKICRTIYNKKMFNWRTKSIRIISNPDNQIPY